jgi:deoxyribodipyrimidine photo-lyase
MKTAVLLFNRDLRVHDHPALAQAAREAERVVPLFVLDDRILRSDFAAPNRLRFMVDSLGDLDASLRRRGAPLVVRRGDPVTETIRIVNETGAEAVFAGADVSMYAQARERRLAEEGIDLRLMPGVTVVPPGDVLPVGGDHYRVFTPYWRRWRDAPRRTPEPAPRRLALPPHLAAGRLPKLADLTRKATSPDLAEGGESAARKRLTGWVRKGIGRYGNHADDLAADSTSRLSPYLRFGCISPLEVESRGAASEPFVRQLCWRDFFAQVTAARPEWSRHDYRPRRKAWARDEAALEAWKTGTTGCAIVDAGMRQLAREGWMHNRARLITASYLTRTLNLDWRHGAAHFWDLLLDGEISNNAGNWQWVAGTGNNTRRNQALNPARQAKRFDPRGEYVERYLSGA